ncbi:MAG: AMMECR1 domain-containing protein [Peptoniphilaceae bacterium]|nr:AMMECR1 domain-containing protein [Peptoniphilaceae bacterium]MDY6019043.1 AMMECR1 domain-containing protein [Anaerococcus sp.]
MDRYIKLAYESIEYYLKNRKPLSVYDDYFRDKNRGIIVRIENKGRLKGQSGSIYPTRKDMGLDIINEAINAGFFSYTFMPITEENLLDHEICVYEFTDVKKIKYIEDFKAYDGICITFNEEVFIFYRKDFKSDMEMFESAIKEANLDSWDVFLIEKFKVKVHKNN